MDCISFFFSSRRRHTRCSRDWSSDVCSTDLRQEQPADHLQPAQAAGGQDRRRCRPPAAARKPGSDPLDGVGPRDAVPLAGPRARRFPAIRPGAGSAALPLLQRGRPCPLPCRARRDRLRGRSGGALRVDHQRAGGECAEARVAWRPAGRDLRAHERGAGSVPALRRGGRDRLPRRPGLPPDRDTRPSARAHIDRADRWPPATEGGPRHRVRHRSAEGRQMSAPWKILVVEDENIVAMDLRASLIALGYEVTDTAGTARGAVDSAQRRKPHLVLMGINLRGETDGIAAADVIHTPPALSVVYLTAFSDEPTLRRGRGTAPFGYL